MVCAMDSTCSSKCAKYSFGFVGLNRFAVQNKSAEIASKRHQFNSDVWSVPYHPKARIKAVLEMSAAQSFTQRSLTKGQN